MNSKFNQDEGKDTEFLGGGWVWCERMSELDGGGVGGGEVLDLRLVKERKLNTPDLWQCKYGRLPSPLGSSSGWLGQCCK